MSHPSGLAGSSEAEKRTLIHSVGRSERINYEEKKPQGRFVVLVPLKP